MINIFHWWWTFGGGCDTCHQWAAVHICQILMPFSQNDLQNDALPLVLLLYTSFFIHKFSIYYARIFLDLVKYTYFLSITFFFGNIKAINVYLSFCPNICIFIKTLLPKNINEWLAFSGIILKLFCFKMSAVFD